MLSIRMQRTGRKGHAMFRVVVQDARRTPTSGKVIALLGSYDPHSKVATLDTEKAGFYLKNGAQPSDRAALLMKKEGVELPAWVRLPGAKSRSIRHADKLRRNRPKDEAPKEETPAEEPAAEAKTAETAEPAPADAPEAETGTTES